MNCKKLYCKPLTGQPAVRSQSRSVSEVAVADTQRLVPSAKNTKTGSSSKEKAARRAEEQCDLPFLYVSQQSGQTAGARSLPCSLTVNSTLDE